MPEPREAAITPINRALALGTLLALATGVAACGRGAAEAQDRAEFVYRENGRTIRYRLVRSPGGRELQNLEVSDLRGRVVESRDTTEVPPPPAEFEDYRTKTPLRLPLGPVSEGRWYVRWGGRRGFQNYHAVEGLPRTRFAYDFIVMRRGWAYRGSGRSNSDYYCWNQPVLAPADGIVTQAAGNRPDNPPGPPRRGALGNQIVIDHGDGERSVFDHLRQGSVQVREGQRVATGQLIGRCGNSGFSRQPHVHYHLETVRGERRMPLPAQFQHYWSDDRFVGRGEPSRGEYVSNG